MSSSILLLNKQMCTTTIQGKNTASISLLSKKFLFPQEIITIILLFTVLPPNYASSSNKA